MFPNVRLMIVAVLASIMGISSALGLFAEFRVSHDSFLRESNAGGPLQLSAGAPPATVMNAAATFGVRFAAEPAPPAVDGTLSSQAFDRAVAVETPRATPSPRAEPAPTAVPAAPSAIAPEPSSQIATAPQPATSAATADFAPGPAGPAASSSIPSQSAAPDIQKNPKPKAADNKPAEAKPAEAKPAEAKPADNLADQPPAAPHSAPAAAPAQTKSTPESQRAPERAAAAAVRRHTTARHRPLIARRVPRTRAAATTQSFTATQPLYQWTQPGQSAQPVRRRPIARPTRPIPKSAQQPQAALSNTSPPDRPE
jgi:hypothetical protein